MFQDQRLIEKPLSHGQRLMAFSVLFWRVTMTTLELDGIGLLVLIMSLINKLEEKSSLKVFQWIK